MANTTINIEFPEYKLKAIEQALEDKEESRPIERILTEHLDGLYQKNVPIQARKYLDAQLGEVEQESVKKSSSPRRNQKRESLLRQENALTIAAAEPAEDLDEQKQEPELSMSM